MKVTKRDLITAYLMGLQEWDRDDFYNWLEELKNE